MNRAPMIAPYVEERPALAMARWMPVDLAAPGPAVEDMPQRRLKSWKTMMSPSQEATAAIKPTSHRLTRPSAASAPPVITSISDGMGGKIASPTTMGMIQI